VDFREVSGLCAYTADVAFCQHHGAGGGSWQKSRVDNCGNNFLNLGNSLKFWTSL